MIHLCCFSIIDVQQRDVEAPCVTSTKYKLKGSQESDFVSFADVAVRYDCHLCEKNFKTKAGMRRHAKHHTKDKIGTDALIKEHGKKCEWQYKFGIKPCVVMLDRCDTQTNNNCDKIVKIEAKRQQKNSSQINTYKCTTCGKIFKELSNLKSHEYVHKDNSEGPLQVKSVIATSKMKKHSALAGQRLFPCTKCNKCYIIESDLKSHLKSHEKDHTVKIVKPGTKMSYKCETCGKTFTKSSHFKNHLFVHLPTSARPYKCEKCEQRFINKSKRDFHMMIHSDEKPFPCPTCDKGFRTQRELKKHETIHTGKYCNVWKHTFAFCY